METGTQQLYYAEEVEELKRKVAEYAEQLNFLLLENQELREKMRSRDVENSVDPPRKMAKAASTSSADGMNLSAGSARAGTKVKITTSTPGSKKVMQAVHTNVFEVRRHMLNAKCTNFSLKQASLDTPVKITVNDANEVSNVRAALKQANVSYHEYKRSDEKHKCFIIKGLIGITEEELPNIKMELIEQGLPEDISLTLLVTGYMRANAGKQHNLPVRLVLPPNVDVKVLDGVKFLNHVAIRFEQFRSKTIIQCKNCQRFGHSAGGCQHQHRCVKCGADHLRADCPRTHSAHHKLKCCNCGGEHTANNVTVCGYFQERFGAIARETKIAKGLADVRNQSGGASPHSSRKQNGVTFAELLRKTNSNHSFNLITSNKSTSNNILSGEFAKRLEAKLDALYKMVINHSKLFDKLLNND